MNTGKPRISPSMMCANFVDLRRDLDLFAEHNVDYLHIDVMDGHYVPNFTLGIDFCKAVARYSPIPFDVHLMIENVDQYIPQFAQLPHATISFHPEVAYHPLRSIQLIKSLGARAGIAVDPSVPIERMRNLLGHVDMVCVMTVNPGYAGQKLVEGGVELIRQAADYARSVNDSIEVEVDGNVSWQNIPLMLEAGAQTLVVGSSSLFDKSAPLSENLVRMRNLLDHCAEERKVPSYAGR